MSALHNEGNVKPDAKVLGYKVEIDDCSQSRDGDDRRQEY
jgi:hypothetical protein